MTDRDRQVGWAADESLTERIARARALLEEAVDPRWRRHLPVMIDPRHMAGVCAVAGCMRETVSEGLCNGHALRWIERGSPDLATFLATTRAVLPEHHALRACAVAACRLGAVRPEGLCRRHRLAWIEAGKPPKQTWAGAVTDVEVDWSSPVCRLPHCELLAEVRSDYCRRRRKGRPEQGAFEAAVMNYSDPRWDFRRLPDQLKVEVQYALQRSRELGYHRSAHPHSLVVRILVRVGATSLLEHDRAGWEDIFVGYMNGVRELGNARALLRFAVDQLADLVDGAGWDNEYPRSVWQLHRLGYVSASASRQLTFTDIGQPWLVDCAKRWLRWRLTVEEKSINTVAADLLALRRLSTFLTATGQAQYSIRQLTRPVLEQHIAWLHEQGTLASSTIRDSISAIAVFLRALRDHEDWAPDLPRTAVIYSSDYPRMDPLRARGLNTHVMTQVRARLPTWPHPDGRFLTELMLATGLRLGDACALGYDPIVFDNDTNPYIRYWNHKMRREAYVPISAATLDRIRAQQHRTRQRFPDQAAAYLATPAPRSLPHDGLRLTPKLNANPHGTLPFHTASYQQQLREFVAAANITDEAGRPAAITAHQWRHTFATGLINRGVRLEVVKQLLDHASLEMSSHYARLLDTTIRAEWEARRGRDADQDDQNEFAHLVPSDVEWANQARTALPNRHCGLPRQQNCDHSNKCLTCPVFITTRDDLPAHEQQRRRTLRLIAQFDDAGQSRLADQNRLVLERLDARIAQIKDGLTATQPASQAGRDAS